MKSFLMLLSVVFFSVTTQATEVVNNEGLNQEMFNALFESDVNLVQELIVAGADANARDINGRPFITVAAEQFRNSNNIGFFRDFLYPSSHSRYVNYDATDVVRSLVRAGADPNARDKIGRTALMKASTAFVANNGFMVETLIRLGANLTLQDNYGMTALLYAVNTNRIGTDVVETLLNTGVIDVTGEEARKSLEIATEINNVPMIKKLREFGIR